MQIRALILSLPYRGTDDPTKLALEDIALY